MIDYFENKNFRGIDFTKEPAEGEYENCTFENCIFSNSDLSDVNFVECVFESCDLSMAKVSNTAFRDAKFKDCKLLGLHFENCNRFPTMPAAIPLYKVNHISRGCKSSGRQI